MRKHFITLLIVLFGLAGCETVHEENLSTYNVHKTVTRTATYPEEEIERLLKQAHVDLEDDADDPDLDAARQDMDLVNQPADYELTIDLNTNPQPPAAFLINGIKTYETKTFKIVISSANDIKFDIPAYRVDVFKSSVKSTASNIVNDKITYHQINYIQLNPTKSGTITIPIKNNIFGKDFELNLNVADSGRSIDTFSKELGFENFCANQPSEEEINKEFKQPKFRSVEFKDGFRFVSYIFEDYYLLYHVLLKEGKVFDVRRVELGQ